MTEKLTGEAEETITEFTNKTVYLVPQKSHRTVPYIKLYCNFTVTYISREPAHVYECSVFV